MFVFGFKLFLHPQHTLNLLLCFMLLSFRLLFVLMLGPLPILSLFLLEKVQIDFLYLFISLLFFPLVTHCSELLIEDVDRATRQITKVVELQRALLRQKAEVVGVRSVEWCLDCIQSRHMCCLAALSKIKKCEAPKVAHGKWEQILNWRVWIHRNVTDG